MNLRSVQFSKRLVVSLLTGLSLLACDPEAADQVPQPKWIWADAISPRLGSAGDTITVRADDLNDADSLLIGAQKVAFKKTPHGLEAQIPQGLQGGRIPIRVTTPRGASNALPFYVRGSNMWIPYDDNGHYSANVVLWTGKELIVWGGYDGEKHLTARGVRYNPVTDTYVDMSTDNAPSPRTFATAVWTGERMILWGGSNTDNTPYLYSPFDDTWSRGATTDAPEVRANHLTAWTGSEMIVWGGEATEAVPGYTPKQLATGGRFNPGRNTWTPMPTAGAPSSSVRAVTAWTGNEWIVWGGAEYVLPNRHAQVQGARFNPRDNVWRSMSEKNAPRPGGLGIGAWTGSRLVVMGADDAGKPLVGSFDSESNAWRISHPEGLPTSPAAWIWRGDRLVMFGDSEEVPGTVDGGGYSINGINKVFEYFPATEKVRVSEPTGWQAFAAYAVAWTGKEYLAYELAGQGLNITRVGADTFSGKTAELAGFDHSPTKSVWTGSELAVWHYLGTTIERYDPVRDAWAADTVPQTWGVNENTYSMASGGGKILLRSSRLGDWGMFPPTLVLYDPAARSWSALESPLPATDPVLAHVTVWDGHEFLAWGLNRDTFPSGWRYNPTTKAWQAIATDAATPRPKMTHDMQGVWIGDAMFVWGSYDAWFDAGDTLALGLYRPEDNTWRSVSTTGAPPRVGYASAVWTGSQVLIWGGWNGSNVRDSGERYDPVLDQWSTIRGAGAANGRASHGAVWTGKRMLIFGGTTDPNPSYMNDLAGELSSVLAYDPDGDAWTDLAALPGFTLGQGSGAWSGSALLTFPGGVYLP